MSNGRNAMWVVGVVAGLGLLGPSVVSATLVGIDYDQTGATTVSGWHSIISADPNPTLLNLTDELGGATPFDFSSTGNFGNSPSPIPAAQLPSHSNPLTDLGDYANAEDLTVTFSDLDPTKSYDIWVFGWRDGSTYGNDTDIIGATTISFVQNSDVLMVNSGVGSSANTLASYAVSLFPTAGGTITIDISSVDNDEGGDPVRIAGFAIEERAPTSTVPEPITATLGLMGLGVLGMATRRRASFFCRSGPARTRITH